MVSEKVTFKEDEIECDKSCASAAKTTVCVEKSEAGDLCVDPPVCYDLHVP